MALLLDVTQNNGVVTSYHRILSIYYQPRASLQVDIASYVSQEIRQAGAAPVSTQMIMLDVGEISVTVPLLQQLYDKLKEEPQFQGAQDA